ncbi:MAG: serine--tRNA ligase, partial [Balneolaceae bacterium]
MLDINFIRTHTDLVKNGMKNKGEKDLSAVDRVLKADEEWRERVTRLEQLRAENNTKAKKIGQLMGEGKKEEAQALIEETSKNKGALKELEKEINQLREDRENLLLRIPNVPHESVPVGETEEDNVIFSTWNQP